MQDTDPAPTISQTERLANWIRLEQTPGVGRTSIRRLLAHFDTPADIFAAGVEHLCTLVSPARARALCAPPPPALTAQLARFAQWVAIPGNHLLTINDPAYPPLLRQIGDPPIVLYAIGRIELLSCPAVAMVGSRNASLQGIANARAFGQALSAAGRSIVSGLAMGIDAAAHEGGLREAGSTIAVLGTGADRIYPARNAELARRIAVQGCIVSEYPLGEGPLKSNFPRRNRIISGLASAVLVIEASEHSGSLITAEYAGDQGRDVFAIPGSIHSALSKGCHKLIKDGAKLVESVDDLLHDLQATPRLTLRRADREDEDEDEDADADADEEQAEHAVLLAALGYGPVDCDTIAAGCDLAPGKLAGQLLSLELAGKVERLPGGLFQRIKP